MVGVSTLDGVEIGGCGHGADSCQNRSLWTRRHDQLSHRPTPAAVRVESASAGFAARGKAIIMRSERGFEMKQPESMG